MKILHFLQLQEIGGIECLFTDYLMGRKNLSLQHHILLHSKRIHPKLFPLIKSAAASISYIKYLGGIKYLRRPRFLRKAYIKKTLLSLKPDLIIFWSHYSEDLVSAAIDLNIPYMYYDHGASWFPSWFNRCPKKTSDFLNQAKALISCSFAAKRMLELQWPLNKEVILIRNPLRQSFTAPQQLKIPSNDATLRLGAAARLIPLKGLASLIYAIDQLKRRGKPCQLSIAGEGREYTSLKELIKKLGVENEVQLLGLVKDMAGFYKDIDIFLVPSLREPLGLVAVEAMAYGCPVICNAVDGLPEVVIHGETGYCLEANQELVEYKKLCSSLDGIPKKIYSPKMNCLSDPKALDPIEIANLIETIDSQSPEHLKMCQNAQERAKNNFSFSEYVSQLEDLIKKT